MLIALSNITGSKRMSCPIKCLNSSGDISPKTLNLVIYGFGFCFSATGAANGTIRWFLNGFNYATTSSITGPMSDLYWTSGFNYPFTVGNRAVGTYPSAAGKFVAIAHLGIWRRALDSSEILQLYNAGN
jgi:hypothetical protein